MVSKYATLNEMLCEPKEQHTLDFIQNHLKQANARQAEKKQILREPRILACFFRFNVRKKDLSLGFSSGNFQKNPENTNLYFGK